MTKKELSMLQNYEWSVSRYGYRTIWQAYGNCSYNKEKAYCNIESEYQDDSALFGIPMDKEMFEFRKYGLTVVNTNSSFFTMAYMIDYIDTETGEIIKQVLVYHTYANRYIIEL